MSGSPLSSADGPVAVSIEQQGKHRSLPGSSDLWIGDSAHDDAAVDCLTGRLQRARGQSSCTAAAMAAMVARPPSVDVNVWLYEQLRVLLCELNSLLAVLSAHCTAASCPVMLATADWEFLCAAHGSKPLKVQPAALHNTMRLYARATVDHSAD